MKFPLVAGLLCANAFLFSLPVSATTTSTLDFEGAICGVSGAAACGAGSQIGSSYGSTADVAVSYQSRTATTLINDFALFWTTGYGDIANVAYSSGALLRVIFTPASNFEVRLVSFDAGCFLFRQSCQSLPWSLTSLSPISSDPNDGSVINSGTATPLQLVADKVTVNSNWSVTPLVFDFGPDSFNGGLDNVVFQSRAVGTGGVVPEPASWAMLIGGFGMVGAALRRRRAITA